VQARIEKSGRWFYETRNYASRINNLHVLSERGRNYRQVREKGIELSVEV